MLLNITFISVLANLHPWWYWRDMSCPSHRHPTKSLNQSWMLPLVNQGVPTEVPNIPSPGSCREYLGYCLPPNSFFNLQLYLHTNSAFRLCCSTSLPAFCPIAQAVSLPTQTHWSLVKLSTHLFRVYLLFVDLAVPFITVARVLFINALLCFTLFWASWILLPL